MAMTDRSLSAAPPGERGQKRGKRSTSLSGAEDLPARGSLHGSRVSNLQQGRRGWRDIRGVYRLMVDPGLDTLPGKDDRHVRVVSIRRAVVRRVRSLLIRRLLFLHQHHE